jgi:hypothetical protein
MRPIVRTTPALPPALLAALLLAACGDNGGGGSASASGTGASSSGGATEAGTADGTPTSTTDATSTTSDPSGSPTTAPTSTDPTSDGTSGGTTGDMPPVLEDCQGPAAPKPAPDPADDALELRYVDDFELMWNDNGSGGWFDGAFYRPIVPNGFFPLAHVGQQDYGVTRGYTFAARELVPGALTPPIAYTKIYDDSGSGADLDGSFWRPTPAPGYVCLGDVANAGHGEPSLDAIRCVRDDLVRDAVIGNGVWNDRGTGADMTFGSWQVVPADDDGLFIGAFVGNDSHTQPPAGPFHVLDLARVQQTPVSEAQADMMIAQLGPRLRLHPDEKFLPDDAEKSLDESASVAWGIIENEGDYDTFKQTPLGAQKTSSATLLADVEAYAKQADNGDPNFRYWLDLALGQAPGGLPPVTGDVKRARTVVRVRAWGPMFTDFQFWVWYPFNGPGKFRVTCGMINDHVVMDGPGRHYGDWEHVSIRVVNSTGELAGVYLSRHSFGQWISGAQLEAALGFDGTHPIVYAARDSHAHYPDADTHYYLRPWSLDAGICTAAVDLEDWTADGGHELALSDPNRHTVVCSNLPDHAPTLPPWLLYDSRWGQYEKLSYTYEFLGLPIDAYDYQEIGSGPSGPPEKGAWESGDSTQRWWWLPALEANELCLDGVDNDGDQKIDCGDEDCGGDPTCNL